MRRFLLLLAACHAPAAVAPVANQVVGGGPVRDDSDALARWHALQLTGDNYDERLASIGDDEAPGMARELLRAGNFACPGESAGEGCDGSTMEIGALDPNADFDDPCLRRELALWSIGKLTPSDGAPLREALEGLVALPAPERELQVAAFSLVDDDDLRMDLMAKADTSLADAQVANLKSRAALRDAATDLHLQSAVEVLARDPLANHDLLVGELTDDDLASPTRLSLIEDTFAGDHTRAAHDALAAIASGEDDCELAEAAAEVLAGNGDASFLPSRPQSVDPSQHMRALCMLSHGSGLGDIAARRAAWVGSRGLETVDTAPTYVFDSPPVDSGGQPNANGDIVEVDGDQVTTTTPVAASDVDMASIDDGIWSATSCTGLTCETGDGLRTFTFAVAGDSLVLAEISTLREDYDDC